MPFRPGRRQAGRRHAAVPTWAVPDRGLRSGLASAAFLWCAAVGQPWFRCPVDSKGQGQAYASEASRLFALGVRPRLRPRQQQETARAKVSVARVTRRGRGVTQAEEAAAAAAPAQTQSTWARRSALGVYAVAAGLAVAAPQPALAAAEPKITARCAFDVRVGNEKMTKLRRLVIGLFGEEAPRMTQTFIQACTGTYPGLSGAQANYKLADVKTIVKDKSITWADFKDGNTVTETLLSYDSRWVGSKTVSRPLAGDDTLTDEVNALRHDLPGRVSMRRGGGTFDFTVAPVENAKWLDKTDVVIGQVLEGMDLIEEINKIKMYGSKPLKKVRIFKSELLEGSS